MIAHHRFKINVDIYHTSLLLSTPAAVPSLGSPTWLEAEREKRFHKLIRNHKLHSISAMALQFPAELCLEFHIHDSGAFLHSL